MPCHQRDVGNLARQVALLLKAHTSCAVPVQAALGAAPLVRGGVVGQLLERKKQHSTFGIIVRHSVMAAAFSRRWTHRRRNHGAAWRIAKVAQERRRIGLHVGKLELVAILRRPVDGAEEELRLTTPGNEQGIPVSAGTLRSCSRLPSDAYVVIDFGGRRWAREDFL